MPYAIGKHAGTFKFLHLGVLTMLKFVATTVLGCCGLACCASDALACGGGCSCSCSMAMPASAPAMQNMPGMEMPPMPPQANAGQAYRTYSYQPAPMTYRPYVQRSAEGYHDAGWKVRGGN